MVALSPGRDSVSLLEMGVTKVALWAKAKRARRTGPSILARFGWFLADVLGTVLMLTSFTVAGFLLSTIAGFAVLGVAFFLLDYKVTVARRSRRAA